MSIFVAIFFTTQALFFSDDFFQVCDVVTHVLFHNSPFPFILLLIVIVYVAALIFFLTIDHCASALVSMDITVLQYLTRCTLVQV